MSIKKTLSIFSKISITSIVATVANIIKMKFFAIFLGVTGFGLISQLINLNLFTTFITTFGLPLGIIKVISEAESVGEFERINGIIKRAFILLLIFALIVMFFFLILSKQISNILYDTDQYYFYIMLFSLSIPFVTMNAVYDSILRGLKKFNDYSKISIFNTITVTFIAIILIYMFNTYGLSINFFISGLLSTILYTFFIVKKKYLSIKSVLTASVKNIYFNEILKIGSASLFMSILDYANLIFLRSIIIKDLGLAMNGIYQSVFAISNNYLGIFTMITGVYSIPMLASIKDINKLNFELNTQIRIFTCIILPIIIAIFIFRDLIILILFTKEFTQASDLFYFNLLGDFFKLLGIVFGIWLIPKSEIKALCFFNFIYNFTYMLFYILIFKNTNLNLVGVTLSYMLGSLCFMSISLIYLIKKNHFKFREGNLKLIINSFVAIIIVFAISRYNINYGYFAFVPVLTIWGYFSISRYEFIKILEILKIRKA